MEDFLILIMDPINEVYIRFKVFFPSLLGMFFVILAGLLTAYLVKIILIKLLNALKFNSWCDRMGFTAVIRNGNIWTKPVEMTGAIVYWLILTGFLMVSLDILEIKSIDNVVSQFFLYIPRAFSAVLIIVIGFLITGFLSRAVLMAAVNSGLEYSKLLAESVRLLLSVLIFSMALEQLQLAPHIIIAAFSIVFGGIVLSLALSFGLGGIDTAKKMLEKGSDKDKKKKEKEVKPDHM